MTARATTLLTTVTTHPGRMTLGFLAILLGYNNVWLRPPGPLVDFPSFHWAAHTAFVEHRSPYTIEALTAGSAAIGQHVFPYLYPPPSLILFYPLTFVAYPTAALLVTWANSLLAAGGVLFVLRNLLRVDASTRFAIAALVYALSFSQVSNTIAHGQVNLLVMLLLAAAWWLSREEGRPFASAVCLGFAIGLKTYPVLLLGYLIVTRRYRMAAYTVGLLGLGVAAGYALLPSAAWTDYWRVILPTGGYGVRPWEMFDPAIPFNQSLNGFMSRLFVRNSWADGLFEAPRLGSALTYLLAAVVAGSTLAVCWRTARPIDRTATDLQWSAMLCVMYLVAPLSWDHHLAMVLPACLVALRAVAQQEGSLYIQVCVSAALCTLAWVVPFRDESLRHGWMPLLISVKLYAVLVIWLYLVWALRRRHAAAQAR